MAVRTGIHGISLPVLDGTYAKASTDLVVAAAPGECPLQ
jgi:hypothetical protein